MTPTQIATQAAEAITQYLDDPSRNHDVVVNALAEAILSAAAKMVRESGAIEALDSAQLGCRLDQRILLQNREKLAAQCDAALEKLRSITGKAKTVDS